MLGFARPVKSCLATASNTRFRHDKAVTYAAIVIVAGVFATTLAQTEVLARLPLQNLLKNELHADRTANAAFFFWAGIAWYLKPLAGILTDAFPLFGSRRKSYVFISSILAALAWFALIATRHEYRNLLIVVIVINTFMVVASTTVGGYMVETAQATSGSGRLTAIRQFIQQACFVINGPVAGYLAGIAFGWTAAACGGIMLLLVPVTILFLREPRKRANPREVLANAKSQLVNIATARTMWGAAGLMALFYIAPGFGTALFYKQQNDLHFTTQLQGFLQLIAGVCGILAAVGYGILCRRLNLRTLLIGCMLIATAANPTEHSSNPHFDTVCLAFCVGWAVLMTAASAPWFLRQIWGFRPDRRPILVTAGKAPPAVPAATMVQALGNSDRLEASVEAVTPPGAVHRARADGLRGGP